MTLQHYSCQAANNSDLFSNLKTQLFTQHFYYCQSVSHRTTHHTTSQEEKEKRTESFWLFFPVVLDRPCQYIIHLPAVSISPFPHIFRIIFIFIHLLVVFKENIPCEKVPLSIYLRMGDINMVFIFSHRCRILIKSNNSDKLYHIYFLK